MASHHATNSLEWIWRDVAIHGVQRSLRNVRELRGGYPHQVPARNLFKYNCTIDILVRTPHPHNDTYSGIGQPINQHGNDLYLGRELLDTTSRKPMTHPLTVKNIASALSCCVWSVWHASDRGQATCGRSRTIVIVVNERHPILDKRADQSQEGSIGQFLRDGIQLRPKT